MDQPLDATQQSNETVNFSRLTNVDEECVLPGAARYLVGVYKTATEQVSLILVSSFLDGGLPVTMLTHHLYGARFKLSIL